jgi:RNA polymerase sigma-70 factor (ECF subfamily)
VAYRRGSTDTTKPRSVRCGPTTTKELVLTTASCGTLAEVTADETSAIAAQERDRDLARRFASGDREVVREIYARYGGAIYTVAIRRLNDPRLAEEAVQDTFVKAWRAASSFEPDRGLSPWLYQIARRAAEDIARRENRQPATITLAPGAGHVYEDGTPLDAWEAWQVRNALSDLPGDERELVRLTHYVGLTQSEIAEQLGIPLGTVKSRVHRAHRRLAARLTHLRGNND